MSTNFANFSQTRTRGNLKQTVMHSLPQFVLYVRTVPCKKQHRFCGIQWKNDFRQVNRRAYNFLLVYKSSPSFFSPKVGGVAVDSFFPIFDVSIHSGDIRDQILKSEIAPRDAPTNCKGADHQNLYPSFYFCLVAHHVDKFGEVIPTGFKVIPYKTLNFAYFLNFCSPLTF